MRYLVLIMALFLSGCVSAADVTTHPVFLSETSPKSAPEVARCLQLRWDIAPVDLGGGEIGFPQRNNFGATLAMVSVKPEGSGSRVIIRKAGKLFLAAHDFRHCT